MRGRRPVRAVGARSAPAAAIAADSACAPGSSRRTPSTSIAGRAPSGPSSARVRSRSAPNASTIAFERTSRVKRADVDARHARGRLDQRLRRVERAAAGHDPLAQHAQVGAVEALLGGRLDRDAGRVGAARRARPASRARRRASRSPPRPPATHGRARRGGDLAGETAHDEGDRHRAGKLHLQARERRLGRPRPRTRRIGVVR